MSVEWDEGEEKRRGPSWTELVNEAALQLGFDNPELARVRGSDLQILEYFKLKNSGQTASLLNWFLRNMSPPDSAIESSALLTALARLELCKRFYTTNYDDFLERAFKLQRKSYSVVALESQMGVSRDSLQIVKFHGDLSHPSQIVLTESDYENRMKLSSPLDYLLRADLLGRIVLFVGYSFHDPNVSYLFRLFTDQFFDQDTSLPGTRAYILVADPSDFECELFRERRMEVIPIDGSHQTESVVEFLEGLIS